jgi:hypothetical protein
LTTSTQSERLYQGGRGRGDCAAGWHKEGDVCVRDEQQEPASTAASDGAGPAIDTSSSEIAAAAAQPAEEPAANVATPDLATGAVTGGAFGSMAWLAILLGVILVLGGGWLIVRGRRQNRYY